jgi:hypothetical protein
MTEMKYPAWQRPYQDALLEVDREKLRTKIDAAETAIFFRMQELAGNSDHHDETLAMHDAQRTLRALQVEKLGYPEFPHEFRDGHSTRPGEK